MENTRHLNTEKKISNEGKSDPGSQTRKRNRITKRAEVKVHQWTFSTEVK